MIAALLLSLQAAPPQPVLVPPPKPRRLLSEHVASVKFDCRLADIEGSDLGLSFTMSGQQWIVGAYDDYDSTTIRPEFSIPKVEISESSDARFKGAHNTKVQQNRRGESEIVLWEKDRSVSAIIRLPQPYDNSDGVPIVAFMAKSVELNLMTTFAGVCSRYRLKDQPQ